MCGGFPGRQNGVCEGFKLVWQIRYSLSFASLRPKMWRGRRSLNLVVSGLIMFTARLYTSPSAHGAHPSPRLSPSLSHHLSYFVLPTLLPRCCFLISITWTHRRFPLSLSLLPSSNIMQSNNTEMRWEVVHVVQLSPHASDLEGNSCLIKRKWKCLLVITAAFRTFLFVFILL